MIEKFISIKNIGKFSDYNASGDVYLGKLNLIFAENGRGKTTLCSILRSLQTGKSEFISVRKTLGSSSNTSINLKMDGKNVVFKNDVWSETNTNICIFDSIFVHENVYAGDEIDHEHKKNLYKVIVGATGVELAHQIEELDSKIKRINTDIKSKKNHIITICPNDVKFESYLSLEKIDDIEIQISKKNDEITKTHRALEKESEIKSKSLLKKIKLPSLPSNFSETLSKELTNVLIDTEEKVKQHIGKHFMGNKGEAWLSQGMNYVSNDNCPFCGVNLETNDLFKAYSSHFNNAYIELKREITQLHQNVNDTIGASTLNNLQKQFLENTALQEFWKQFINIDLPDLKFEEIQSIYVRLCKAALELVQKKQQRPVEIVLLDTSFSESIRDLNLLQQSIEVYNSKIDECNSNIETQKKSVIGEVSLQNLKAQLNRLQANKNRFTPQIDKLCKEYEDLQKQKFNLEKEKENIREKLDTYSKDVMEEYETSINEYLKYFHAGFRIVNTTHDHIGGVPRSVFQIKINNTLVDVGNSKNNTPSFKTTLSSGDKSALALAFFLASLKHDQNIEKKIIVMDDPFNSLDRFRRDWTAHLIIDFAKLAEQIIVLSHDPHFLKLIKDKKKSDITLKQLRINKSDKISTIIEWNVDIETQSLYFTQYCTLRDYLRGDNNLKDAEVAKTMRIFLETLYQTCYPGHFPDRECLEYFIKKVREADSTSGLYQAKPDLENLEHIKNYTNSFHHSSLSAPNSDELARFVEMTLSFVGDIDNE